MNRTNSTARTAQQHRAALKFYAGAGRLRIACAFVRNAHDPRCELRETALETLLARLARPAVREEKDGGGFVPARLREPYRLGEHVLSVTALVYDVEAHQPTDPQPPMPAEVAARCAALGWMAFIYTTFSHEPPERVRYRLLLPLDTPLPPDAYRAVWHLPVREIELSGWCDRSCRDPARFYYLPACPPERAHLFEAHRVDGRPLCSAALVRAAAAERALHERVEAARIAVIRSRGGDPGRYGAAALASACGRIAGAAAGCRNHTLNREAHGLARLVAGGLIDGSVALDALAQAAAGCGLEAAEIRATLRSAWRAGMRSPRVAGGVA